MPNGAFFWSTSSSFDTFYDATQFIEHLFVNPNITEIKMKKD